MTFDEFANLYLKIKALGFLVSIGFFTLLWLGLGIAWAVVTIQEGIAAHRRLRDFTKNLED